MEDTSVHKNFFVKTKSLLKQNKARAKFMN